MCDATCSESGQLLTIKPCGWYVLLQSDRDRLAGVVAGMEEQGKRNLGALRRAEGQTIALQKQIDVFNKERFRVGKENASLRDEIEIIKREHQEHCAEAYNNAVRQITALKEENARLREAVEFYAYAPGGDNLIMVERGAKARNALKEVG